MSAPRIEAVVTAVRADAGEVRVIDLRPEVPMDCASPSGSHIDLYLPGGMVRQYSLIGQCSEVFRVAVRREDAGRGGSIYVHERLVTGARVQIGAPRSLLSSSS